MQEDEDWSKLREDIKDLTGEEISQDNPISRKYMVKMWKEKRNYKAIYVAESETRRGQHYLVGLREDGRWVGTCPHYIFREGRIGGECKHITAIRDNPEAVPIWDKEKAMFGEVLGIGSITVVNDMIYNEDRSSIFSEDDFVLNDESALDDTIEAGREEYLTEMYGDKSHEEGDKEEDEDEFEI